MIQLENVHKSYGQTKVLKGIDLQIQDHVLVVYLKQRFIKKGLTP